MAKQKMRRIREVNSFSNVFQAFGGEHIQIRNSEREVVAYRNEWAPEWFGNNHPITLELGCGKGDYTLRLARQSAKANFIGVDVKGPRIWRGAQTALHDGLHNVAFVRTRIEQIEQVFAPGEIDSIWITFPDPFPRHRDRRRRLISPPFLNRYRNILKPEAEIHLKTDAPDYMTYAREVIANEGVELAYVADVPATGAEPEVLNIHTYYEQRHRREGRRIQYARFKLRP